jgi:hypothetical protein
MCSLAISLEAPETAQGPTSLPVYTGQPNLEEVGPLPVHASSAASSFSKCMSNWRMKSALSGKSRASLPRSAFQGCRASDQPKGTDEDARKSDVANDKGEAEPDARTNRDY